jgi:hypothetical protein
MKLVVAKRWFVAARKFSHEELNMLRAATVFYRGKGGGVLSAKLGRPSLRSVRTAFVGDVGAFREWAVPPLCANNRVAPIRENSVRRSSSESSSQQSLSAFERKKERLCEKRSFKSVDSFNMLENCEYEAMPLEECPWLSTSSSLRVS